MKLIFKTIDGKEVTLTNTHERSKDGKMFSTVDIATIQFEHVELKFEPSELVEAILKMWGKGIDYKYNKKVKG